MEILNYQDVIGHKSVIGEFDVYIPALQLTIRKFKANRTAKGYIMLTSPSYCKEENGEKKWFPYFSFSKEREKAFQDELRCLLKPFLGT